MKVFADSMTRGATKALLVHGIVLLLIGLRLFFESYSYLRRLHGSSILWHMRIYLAVCGWGLAIVVGMGITFLAMLRLRKPFEGLAAAGLSSNFKALFVAEVFIVFIIGGLILDGGEIQGRMLLWTIALNLLLLGLFGRSSRRGRG